MVVNSNSFAFRTDDMWASISRQSSSLTLEASQLACFMAASGRGKRGILIKTI